MTQLRPYQQAAVEAVCEHLRTRDDNPAVVLPTAAGKSWIIAQIVKDAVLRWNGRVIVLAHVKELLEQNVEKIRKLCPEVPIGIYSAGLNRRDTDKPVIVAGIQSVYKRACELDAFDLVIVDEAHLIAPDGEGMYRTFLAEAKIVNPYLRVIGLTATTARRFAKSTASATRSERSACQTATPPCAGSSNISWAGGICRPMRVGNWS